MKAEKLEAWLKRMPTWMSGDISTIFSEQEGDRISFRFYDATNSLNIPIDDTVSLLIIV